LEAKTVRAIHNQNHKQMETTYLGNFEKDKAIALVKKFYVDAL